MSKLIKSRSEVRDKIDNALRLITEPVVQTLSPRGRNVAYEDANGGILQTNDGVTIARQIESDDPVEQAVIDIVKHSALRTNAVAGDGTTTTILLSNALIRDGLKLIDEGKNPMELQVDLLNMGESLVSRLKPIKIEDDEQLEQVARISSNNDDQIAEHVTDIIKTAGEHGMVVIETHPKEETRIDKDTGFIVDGGLFSPEYAQNNGFISTFDDCAVLVCDKRIYYEEEAETILRVAIESGIPRLVIVARDFIGKSVNVFSANHQNNGAIELMLVKDPNAGDASNSLNDLAVYLGGEVITDKKGKLVNNLSSDDFCMAKKVYSNPQRTVISSNGGNKQLDNLVKSLREEKDKDDSDKEVNRRLAALTNGMVTVYVGGNTAIEVQEKVFRYEDAINATRSAMSHGYLAGGGLSLMSAYVSEDHPQEYQKMVQRYCEAPIRQIARNCGKHEDTVIGWMRPSMGEGYNAKTDRIENLQKLGSLTHTRC